MGGYGSGRWKWGKSDAKTLVEDCRSLEINRLVREKVVRPEACARGRWVWSRDGAEVASIGYVVTTQADSGTLHLFYTVGRDQDRQSLGYDIPLVTTVLVSGGLRWWFVCVASRDGGPTCHRRVGKLYLAPGGTVFACRHCYDLAYTSSRESRKWDALFQELAIAEGLPVGEVKAEMMQDRRACERTRLRKELERALAKAPEKPGRRKGGGA
jgi:hypothetical protein